MKGTYWNGTTIDLTNPLRPLMDAMRRRQQALGLSGREMSKLVGKCSTWHSSLLNNYENPTVARLAWWGQLIRVQELGVVAEVGGEYATCTVYDCDREPPWTIIGNRQYANLRNALGPLRLAFRRRRRDLFGRAEDFGATLGLARSTVFTMEAGNSLDNPTVGYLANWAGSLKFDTIGPYVIIDGEYTEVDLLATEEEQ